MTNRDHSPRSGLPPILPEHATDPYPAAPTPTRRRLLRAALITAAGVAVATSATACGGEDEDEDEDD